MLFVLVLFVGNCLHHSNAVDGKLKESITLTCDLTTQNTIRWAHFSSQAGLFQDLPTNYTKYDGLTGYRLTIKQLTFDDDGAYRCHAYNGNNQFLLGTTHHLTVKEVVYARIGESAVLSCKTSGNYRYHWKIDNIFLHDNGYKYSGAQAKTLTILNIRSSDVGQYQCFVYRSNGVNIATERAIIVDIVDGYWSSWTSWTSCPVTCGGGSQKRTRTCIGPNGGVNYCTGGAATDTQTCSSSPCPVNGYWDQWTSWSSCSVTCGGGQQARTRQCVGPFHGGSPCSGESKETIVCSKTYCPIDGGWSVWLEWSVCTAACGEGNRSRNRTCDNPPPAYSGKPCDGSNQATETCSVKMCASYEAQTLTNITPGIVGGIIGSLIVITAAVVGIVIFMKRRTYSQRKDNAYENHIRDSNKDIDHVYSSTQRIYVNEQISMERQKVQSNAPKQSLLEYLLTPYHASDLAERLHNNTEHGVRLEAEIKYLSKMDTSTNAYELDDNEEEAENIISVFQGCILIKLAMLKEEEQFWRMVTSNGVTKIVMVLEKIDKVDGFIPTFENSLIMDGMTVDFESAEKCGDNFLVMNVKLKQKKNHDLKFIKIFKTIINSNERLQPLEACILINKIVDTVDGSIFFVAGNGTKISDVSVLAVCCNAIKKIKLDEKFNVLVDTGKIKTLQYGRLNENEDLSYCYDVLKEYLEFIHTYDMIM